MAKVNVARDFIISPYSHANLPEFHVGDMSVVTIMQLQQLLAAKNITVEELLETLKGLDL